MAVGTLDISIDEVFKNKTGKAISNCVISDPKPSLNNILHGKIYPQNIPSILVCHELCLESLGPSDYILDLCAAPGGIIL